MIYIESGVSNSFGYDGYGYGHGEYYQEQMYHDDGMMEVWLIVASATSFGIVSMITTICCICILILIYIATKKTMITGKRNSRSVSYDISADEV